MSSKVVYLKISQPFSTLKCSHVTMSDLKILEVQFFSGKLDAKVSQIIRSFLDLLHNLYKIGTLNYFER